MLWRHSWHKLALIVVFPRAEIAWSRGFLVWLMFECTKILKARHYKLLLWIHTMTICPQISARLRFPFNHANEYWKIGVSFTMSWVFNLKLIQCSHHFVTILESINSSFYKNNCIKVKVRFSCLIKNVLASTLTK